MMFEKKFVLVNHHPSKDKWYIFVRKVVIGS